MKFRTMGTSASHLNCSCSENKKLQASKRDKHISYVEDNIGNEYDPYEDLGSKKNLERYDTYFGLPRAELMDDANEPEARTPINISRRAMTSDRSSWNMTDKVAICLDANLDENFFDSTVKDMNEIKYTVDDRSIETGSTLKKRRGKREKSLENTPTNTRISPTNSNATMEQAGQYFDF